MSEMMTKEIFHIIKRIKKMKLFNNFKKSPHKLYKRTLQTYYKQTKSYEIW
jgi:hypothetical protein